MKNITMIAAIGKNNELGKNNQLIWHLKEDLKFFRDQTINKPIVMGIKTFESLPGLLPKRKHIVLTRRDIDLGPEVDVFHSIDELLNSIKEYEEVMIIGGASIYKQFLEYADKLILTEIEAEDSSADAYFPTFNHDEWNAKLIAEKTEGSISYKHLVYTRK